MNVPKFYILQFVMYWAYYVDCSVWVHGANGSCKRGACPGREGADCFERGGVRSAQCGSLLLEEDILKYTFNDVARVIKRGGSHSACFRIISSGYMIKLTYECSHVLSVWIHGAYIGSRKRSRGGSGRAYLL